MLEKLTIKFISVLLGKIASEDLWKNANLNIEF